MPMADETADEVHVQMALQADMAVSYPIFFLHSEEGKTVADVELQL